MSYKLTVSVHKGMGHIAHNNRTIAVPHADKSRQHLNMCFANVPIEQAYEELFGEALKDYNQGKKPSRQIKDYYEHIMKQYRKGEEKLQKAISSGASRKEQAKIKSTYPKPFSEIIVAVGNCKDYSGAFANGGELEQIAIDTLTEYVETFKKRNPHLYVFNTVLHRDEPNGIPHLHIDYIPWSDTEQSRGLKVRVSEHGAFEQQCLGNDTEYGTIAFQRQEREALTEIAKNHDIEVIEGKHSKRHLTKEEYILSQEKELVNEQAMEVLKYQDELIEYISTADTATAYFEHLENKELHKTVQQYGAIKERSNTALALAWNEFNSSTSAYFAQYRRQKELLQEELQRARANKKDSRKRLKSLLNAIAYGNDYFILKLLLLAVALFVAIENAVLESEVRYLQEKNAEIRATAKKVMSDSKKVGETLRTGDIAEIEKAVGEYDIQLKIAIDTANGIAERSARGEEEIER